MNDQTLVRDWYTVATSNDHEHRKQSFEVHEGNTQVAIARENRRRTQISCAETRTDSQENACST